MFLVWFMKSRHRKLVRRVTRCTLVVLYLLVATASNLFHTEVYDVHHPNSDSQTDTNDPGVNITAVSSNQLLLASIGDFCPVCAFLKIHQGQTPHLADFISVNTPPACDFTIAGVFIPHKRSLPALPTRGPPAVLS